MKKLNFCKLAGAVLAAALMSSTASAQTIRLTAASSHPPVLPWVGVLKAYPFGCSVFSGRYRAGRVCQVCRSPHAARVRLGTT